MRNRVLDIAKGIAIRLVMLGHISLTPEYMKAWLYTFHIPLFFMCSGILFSPEKYGDIKRVYVCSRNNGSMGIGVRISGSNILCFGRNCQ